METLEGRGMTLMPRWTENEGQIQVIAQLEIQIHLFQRTVGTEG